MINKLFIFYEKKTLSIQILANIILKKISLLIELILNFYLPEYSLIECID
jgi:hypothetical protein